MGCRSFLIACLMIGVAAGAAWADPFNEVPAGTWCYGTSARLVSLGLLPADPATSFSGKPALTRFEFATSVLQPLSEVDRARRSLTGKPGPKAVREAAAEALNLNPKSSELEIAAAVHDLIRLGVEFGPELRTLGFDPTEAIRALQSLAEPAAAREWRVEALARLRPAPAVRPGTEGEDWRLPLGHGAVALNYATTGKVPEILDTLAMATPGDVSRLGPGGGATAALSDPSISRLRTAYEYAIGSALTLSLGREEIARRGSNLLPLDAATLTSLGIGYRVTPSTSVKVTYSLLDYQNYVSNAPPVRERVAETAVSIEF